jgi:NAD(P)H dehydrogenase (quinone)
MNYAVSLGNSHLGKLAIGFLLEKGIPAGDIKAVVRNVEKARDLAGRGIDIRHGEYGNEASLLEAFKGVTKVYMISGMAPPAARTRQHRGVIDAAKAAGVSHVVYTSFIDTAEDSPFFAWKINKDTEAYLERSGLSYTILRHGMYSEADLDYIGEYVKAGKVANNIGDGTISYISRRDLALAAVHCLLEDGHIDKTYALTGPEAITQTELARRISEWKGMEIPYVQISDEEYKATFPEAMWGEVIVSLYQSVRVGNTAIDTDDFEQITGRKPYSLAETYDRFYAKSSCQDPYIEEPTDRQRACDKSRR